MPKRKQHKAKFGQFNLTKRNGSEVWYCEWYDERTKQTRRVSLRTRNQREAEKLIADRFILNEPLRDADPKGVPLAVILERYYDRHGQHVRSHKFARLAIDRFTEFFGDAPVADITPDYQRRFVGFMSKNGASSGYIKRFFTGVLRPALSHAYDNGELERVPPILKPREFEADRERDRILTPTEVAGLWDATKSLREADARERLRMWLMLAINTLARPEALTDLTRFQVDFERQLIKLNPTGRKQTKKRRPDLPITDSLLPYLLQSGAETFIHCYGRPVKASSLNKPFRRLREVAGLDSEVVPYSLRHTLATELAARDVPPWQIQSVLGHRAYGTSDRYMKARPDFLGDAAAAIDDYCRELDKLTEIPFLLPDTGKVVSISRQFRAS